MENNRLKEIADQIEKEADEKDSAIQELLQQLNACGKGDAIQTIKPKNETHLIAALRRQIKDFREEIIQKDEKIKILQRHAKITKLAELEIANQICNDETERLKSMLQEIINQKMGGYTESDVQKMEDTIYQQTILINNMRDENGKLAVELQKKDEDYGKLRELLVELEKDSSKYKKEYNDNTKSKKQLKDVTKEIQKCKEQLASIKLAQKDKQQAEFQSKINQLLNKQSGLNETLTIKTKALQELETKESSERAKQESLKNEAIDLKQKLEKYEKELSIERKNQKKIMPTIRKEEVEKMGWILKLSFMEQKISALDIKKVFFL